MFKIVTWTKQTWTKHHNTKSFADELQYRGKQHSIVTLGLLLKFMHIIMNMWFGLEWSGLPEEGAADGVPPLPRDHSTGSLLEEKRIIYVINHEFIIYYSRTFSENLLRYIKKTI